MALRRNDADGQHGDRAGQERVAGSELGLPAAESEGRNSGGGGPTDRLVHQLVDELTQSDAETGRPTNPAASRASRR